MNLLDITAIGLQIILPISLIAWLLLAPMKGRLGFLLHALSIGLALTALLLVAGWMMPPWWTPYLFLALWLLVVISRAPGRLHTEPWFPRRWADWTPFVLILPLGVWSVSLTMQALWGRSPPPSTQVIDLAFPLGPGTYLVANGGATEVVNSHFITLDPETDRQQAYRGQSYGVDLVRLGPAGVRASGWRPSAPTAYAIFGQPVYAPCSGKVVTASDGMPDMPVPETDTSRLEGNHVMLDCGEYAVLLAHFRNGSLRVREGEGISKGQVLGEVGNSGQSTEPHLHVHVQRLPETGPILSGEPLHLTFDGRFPVRNDRLKTRPVQLSDSSEAP